MNKVRLLVMDVDGTLTDGKIYMSDKGELCRAFNIKDGCGIHDILIPAGIIPVIITGRESDIVLKRCAEMGVTEVYQGVSDKKCKLERILSANGCSFSNAAYIGDDINDLKCMNAVKRGGGIVGCPSDSISAVFDIADFISTKKGGDGAVREFIDWLVTRQ